MNCAFLTGGLVNKYSFGKQTVLNKLLIELCCALQKTLARFPICSNCFQICSFCTVANRTPPCLSVCLERKASPHLSVSCKVRLQPTPSPHVCLSVCLSVQWQSAPSVLVYANVSRKVTASLLLLTFFPSPLLKVDQMVSCFLWIPSRMAAAYVKQQ